MERIDWRNGKNVNFQLKSRSGNYIAGQLVRCGLAPALLYGEAQSVESRDDFIHKMKICLKELRETRRWARLIDREHWLGKHEQLAFVLGEIEELIRIFKASVQTAERNRASTRRGIVRAGPCRQ